MFAPCLPLSSWERELIWKLGLCRGNQVQMKSHWSGVGPQSSDCCPYRTREIWTQTQGHSRGLPATARSWKWQERPSPEPSGGSWPPLPCSSVAEATIRASQVCRSRIPRSLTHRAFLAFGCGLHICFLQPWAYLLPPGLSLQITPGTLPCSPPESTQRLARGKPRENFAQSHKTLSECHLESPDTMMMVSLQASQGGLLAQVSGISF